MEGGFIETVTAVLEDLAGRLQAVDIESLLRNPYFLVASGVFAVVAVVKRLIGLLVLYVAAVALAALFHYTVPGGDVGTLDTRQLVIFAGGALAIGAVVIYFLLIRSD